MINLESIMAIVIGIETGLILHLMNDKKLMLKQLINFQKIYRKEMQEFLRKKNGNIQ